MSKLVVALEPHSLSMANQRVLLVGFIRDSCLSTVDKVQDQVRSQFHMHFKSFPQYQRSYLC